MFTYLLITAGRLYTTITHSRSAVDTWPNYRTTSLLPLGTASFSVPFSNFSCHGHTPRLSLCRTLRPVQLTHYLSTATDEEGLRTTCYPSKAETLLISFSWRRSAPVKGWHGIPINCSWRRSTKSSNDLSTLALSSNQRKRQVSNWGANGVNVSASFFFFSFFLFLSDITSLSCPIDCARVSVPPSFPHDAGCLAWTSADGQDVTREMLQATVTSCWCLWDRFFGDRCRFHRPTN